MPEMVSQDWLEQERERHRARPWRPAVAFEQDGEHGEGWRMTGPGGVTEEWEVAICAAFATRSESLVWTFLDQFRALMGDSFDGTQWVPDEFAINAAVAMVVAAQPQNEIQTALVAQMVAMHFMTMKAAQHHGRSMVMDPRDVGMVSKLARTYAMQAETLGKLQGKVKTQHITVSYERHEHHHTHVHDERHVHLSGGGPGNRGQGYEPDGPIPLRTDGDASSPALPGPHTRTDALSEAGDQGAGQMPAPRMRQRVRGSTRRAQRQLSHRVVDCGIDGSEGPCGQGAEGVARVEG